MGFRIGLHIPVKILNILHLPGIEQNVSSCPASNLFAILTKLSLLLSYPKVRKYMSCIKSIAHFSFTRDHGFKSRDTFITQADFCYVATYKTFYHFLRILRNSYVVPAALSVHCNL
jgi:hypothetical protein